MSKQTTLVSILFKRINTLAYIYCIFYTLKKRYGHVTSQTADMRSDNGSQGYTKSAYVVLLHEVCLLYFLGIDKCMLTTIKYKSLRQPL